MTREGMGPSQGPEGPHQFKAGWMRSKLWEKLRRAGQRGRREVGRVWGHRARTGQ